MGVTPAIVRPQSLATHLASWTKCRYSKIVKLQIDAMPANCLFRYPAHYQHADHRPLPRSTGHPGTQSQRCTGLAETVGESDCHLPADTARLAIAFARNPSYSCEAL